MMSRPVPAEFGVEGYFFRHERHFVYWRRLSNDDIGIVTILHERMHQIDRFKDDYLGKLLKFNHHLSFDPSLSRALGGRHEVEKVGYEAHPLRHFLLILLSR
ncbi:hypothetical protein O9Z70_05175 [Devosia sp. YIM 151766]|uniref:hypothetical protein n=1 Tax=Devosia sp. YIM 151766 TaxID=3017325 RepID=UPI00255C704C|nr:hypothetical protein [Devosia sp. YIM 151766]WIY53928.1 hypothetical protein O9Z70_05175 [Devosia sp. YIM 151766]